MKTERFEAITARYPDLRIAVVGDFCLDRYLEIDPARQEVSIETGLPVHNVVKVRAQPGGAGTILNNLSALGVGNLYPIGFAGLDGEGFELCRALAARRGVQLEHFFQTEARRTFTYCKPLVVETGRPPRELNRLDSKNWTPTPPAVEARVIESVTRLTHEVSAFIVLSQVDTPETGVVTTGLLKTLTPIATAQPALPIVADSRHGFRGYPPVTFKMNAAELAAFVGARTQLGLAEIKKTASELAKQQGRPVFVTLSERGIIGAAPTGEVEHIPALPVRGEIDIVGAGDAVTANLTVALAAGATLHEALEIASAAASVVIHQLGTTGTASVPQMRELLFGNR